ncbi:growth hormone secretagogue receptor type 1-like [Ruditapes philippinarum]|uniref:growth hormone secretagogue receptor type 1-like n=1 Tax=Ruditapes philippinarum TaxID=129788 RepID=UPI00295AB543|nr:growth hormone secretagogue receptor type 1-like [Ruditapes philippinarum]
MYIRPYEEYFMGFDNYVVHRYILLIVPPILLIIGSVGNILSFCILFKNTNKASTYTFLSALALADLLVLYVGLLRIWIGQFMTDILDTNNIVCKAGIFLGYVCSDISVWLIVAVTVERFIVVMFPMKAPRLCNTRNARITIIFIIFVFIAVNTHFIWTVELHNYYFDTIVISKCEAKMVYTNLVEVLWPWVDAGIYSFVPFLVIMILNSFIIINIISAQQTRFVLRQQTSLQAGKHVQNQNRKQAESSKRITVMLLLVSFTFLITTLPMNLVLIFTSFSNERDNDDDKVFAKWKLVSSCTEMLMYVNHCINFFLYCITGKKFRDQFKRLILRSCMSTFSEIVRGSSQRFSSTSFKTTKTVFVDKEIMNGNGDRV